MRRIGAEAAVESHYDVVVVGAGMVGASVALGLDALDLRVLLLDAADMTGGGSAASASFDDRSTALSFGSREILHRLGAWDALASQVTPITDIHVSEQGKLGTTRMSAGAYGIDALGYVAPNKALGKALFSRLEATHIDFWAPVQLSSVASIQEGAQLELISGDENPQTYSLQTKLLLIVDGACSSTAQKLGIDYQVSSYGQHAVIANVESIEAHAGRAFERFSQNGPLALLPLGDFSDFTVDAYARRFALIWSVADDVVQTYLDMSDKDFLTALDDAMGGRLGGFTSCGKRQVYPLKLTRPAEVFRPGILLLGNAAHSLHPVAGQGFNLALRGVASFLEALSEGLEQGAEIGALSVLQAAADRHQQDALLTVNASDQLVRQFGQQGALLGIAREMGLVGLNNVPLAKRLFVEQAMGQGRKAARFKAVERSVHG